FTTWIFSQIKNNVSEVNLTTGEQKRDFIYIDDVVSAYLICLDNLERLERFTTTDVGTGVFTPVRSFVESVKEIYENLTGKEVSTRLNFGAIPYREGEIMEPKVDNRKLLALGWKPTVDLRKNITEFIKKEIK
ncbi:NAD-dependent epimerase/dehydratase family protein, partial [Capnocytophaga stomatis]